LNLFPNECRSTYYIPAIPKNESSTNKAVMARGKLIDKCRNMLYTSNDKSYVRKRKCLSDSSFLPLNMHILQDGKKYINVVEK